MSVESNLYQIQKRNGQIVQFNPEKIESAIGKAFKEFKYNNTNKIKSLSEKVIEQAGVKFKTNGSEHIPSVEDIQDIVEKVLMEEGHFEVAKAFIIYRNSRAERRALQADVPENIKKLTQDSKQYFSNQFSEVVYYRTYSRWLETEGRRETWVETVDRYMSFMKENLAEALSDKDYKDLRTAIINQQVMPSMRLLQFSGRAARKSNMAAYNCSFLAPTKLKDFADIVYILMCGTGLGFSVESRNVQKLPQIENQTGELLPGYVIKDSKEGWADALLFGMEAWYSGKDVEFDYSSLRPAGARLKTMGGRSSGPGPLRSLLDFTRQIILSKQGRRLAPIDVHDIITKIGEIVVAGGVRRSALISLSDLDDAEMRDAKKGQFYIAEPQRSMANNSSVYQTKPTMFQFMDEWVSLMKSGSGERGIFNRSALDKTLPARRVSLLGDRVNKLGTNPCGEIILQDSGGLCNLSEVVCRPDDTLESLVEKTRLATILGTYQATLTNFPYVASKWRRNCEEERLLGVSLTGQWDCDTIRDKDILSKLREVAITTNKRYSKKFGINESAAITCVKPSGTLSSLVDCSPGMHPRHSPFYIRRMRINATDPLLKLLRDQGVPYFPEVGQTMENATTFVLEFPIKAPVSKHYKDTITALDQLEHWRMVKTNFTEHNPSVTVSVGDNEWLEVANWVYNNWDIVGGLSFLPREKHVYQLAPYEAITEEEYNQRMATFPNIDFSRLYLYEKEDNTEQAKELACVSGFCEIV